MQGRLDNFTDPGICSFVAMQYYALFLNRTCEVFISPDRVHVAKVGGLRGAPINLDDSWKDPGKYVDQRLRERYRSIDLNSPAFNDLDPANYSFLREDILQVQHRSRKWGMGSMPYSGRLIVVLRGRRRHEFILLGTQDPAVILSMLTATHRAVT